MPPKKIRRRVDAAPPPPDPAAVVGWTKQFLELKRQEKLIAERKKSLYNTLVEIVEEHGYESEGSFYFDLDAVVEVGGKAVTRLQRRRHEGTEFNEEHAEKILSKKTDADGTPLLERCIDMVPTWNEDEIGACVLEKLLTEKEYDRIFEKKISYQFWQV